MSFLILLFHDRATFSNLIDCDEENGETANAAEEISELEDTRQTEEPTEEVVVDETSTNQGITGNSQPRCPKSIIKCKKVEMISPSTVSMK
jgi:hypothetical protein